MAKKPFGPKGPRDEKKSDSKKFGHASKGPKESTAPKFGSAAPKAPKKQAAGGFDKFAKPKISGAKLKEQLKVERKTAVKERRAAIEAHFEKKRQEKAAQYEERGKQITGNPNQALIFDNKKEEKKFGKKAFKKTEVPKDDFKKSDYEKSEELLARKSNQNAKFKEKNIKGRNVESRNTEAAPDEKRPIKPFVLNGKTEPNKPKKVYDTPKQKKVKPTAVKPVTPPPTVEKNLPKKEKLSDEEILNKKNIHNYKPQFTRPYTRKPLVEITPKAETAAKTTAKPEEKKGKKI